MQYVYIRKYKRDERYEPCIDSKQDITHQKKITSYAPSYYLDQSPPPYYRHLKQSINRTPLTK